MVARRLALAPVLFLAAACAAPVPAPTPVPTAVAASSPTAAPSPSMTGAPSAAPTLVRPSPPADAPPIAAPYWLLDAGSGTATVTGPDGVVLSTDRSRSFQVIDGGSVSGEILVNGEWVGTLTVTETEGESIPGLDPVEEQFGAQIDDVLPDPSSFPDRSPNPFWIRSSERRGGLTVHIRRPAEAAAAEVSVATEGFWWDGGHEKWYRLSVDPDRDFDDVLTAVLGA